MIKPLKIMTLYTLWLVTAFIDIPVAGEKVQTCSKTLKISSCFMFFHRIPPASLNIRVLRRKAFTVVPFKGMCGQPTYLARVVLTVIDFSPVWYSAHRSLSASLMKHRPTVPHFSPAVSGRLSQAWERGRQQGDGEPQTDSQLLISRVGRAWTVRISKKKSLDSCTREGQLLS